MSVGDVKACDVCGAEVFFVVVDFRGRRRSIPVAHERPCGRWCWGSLPPWWTAAVTASDGSGPFYEREPWSAYLLPDGEMPLGLSREALCGHAPHMICDARSASAVIRHVDPLDVKGRNGGRS